MTEKEKRRISKFLSFVLRHKPDTIKLQLEAEGWVNIAELISKSAQHNVVFDMEELKEVVATNDKQRFAFNGDETKIRASQGHSVNVDLNLEAQQPPEELFHGTVSKFLDAIKEGGLKKMSRQHVHLSADRETAQKVGSRRGIAVMLVVKSGEMHRDGFSFFLSENNVWLTDAVETKYIKFQD